jgi:hypothetical protein
MLDEVVELAQVAEAPGFDAVCFPSITCTAKA